MPVAVGGRCHPRAFAKNRARSGRNCPLQRKVTGNQADLKRPSARGRTHADTGPCPDASTGRNFNRLGSTEFSKKYLGEDPCFTNRMRRSVVNDSTSVQDVGAIHYVQHPIDVVLDNHDAGLQAIANLGHFLKNFLYDDGGQTEGGFVQ